MPRFPRFGRIVLCAALLAASPGGLPPKVHAVGSGDYNAAIVGPAALSGTIRVMLDADSAGPAAVFAPDEDSPVTGAPDSLTITTLGPYVSGILGGGSITLNTVQDTRIDTQGSSAYGLVAAGYGARLALDGPVSVTTSGQYAHAALIQGLSGWQLGLDLPGPLTLNTSGEQACGLYVFDGLARLGAANITTTGTGGHALRLFAGKAELTGPATLSASGNGAYAMLLEGWSPASNSVATTRVNSAQANPQTFVINGALALNGSGNQILLDLDAGSRLNSDLFVADSAGAIQLNFYAADARWNTGFGSTIQNGSTLRLAFVSGGQWGLPVTDASNAVLPDAAVPLRVASGGQLVVSGGGELLAMPATSLKAGESGRYALISAANGVPAAASALPFAADHLLYRADGTQVETVNGVPTLTGTLTRLSVSEGLPDLSPGPGGLLPDGGTGGGGGGDDSGGSSGGNGNAGGGTGGGSGGDSGGGLPANDGAGNPFLALALAGRGNGLTVDQITAALEGAPALTRALPIASLTRSLARHARKGSPVSALHGHTPRATAPLRARTAGDETADSGWRMWMAPLYLRESEHIPYDHGLSTHYTAWLGGAQWGLERRLPLSGDTALTLGIGVSAGHGRARSRGAVLPETRADMDSIGGQVYALWEQGAWSLGLEGALLRLTSDLTQQNPVMPLAATVRTEALSLEAVAARRFLLGEWELTPHLGLEYTFIRQGGHSIRGTLPDNAGLVDLFVNNALHQHLLHLTTGLSVGRTFQLSGASAAADSAGWTLRPQAHARFIPTLSENNPSLQVWRADAPMIGTALSATPLDRRTLEAGLELEARRGGLRLSLAYAWQGSSHRNAHLLSGSFAYTF